MEHENVIELTSIYMSQPISNLKFHFDILYIDDIT